jgi:hypothetical protein
MTTSKPQSPPVIDLSSTGVDVLSPPPDDTDIVIAGDALSFRLNLAITGFSFVVAMYAGEPVEVSHHIEEVETGTRFTLGPFPWRIPCARATPAGFAAAPGAARPAADHGSPGPPC